MNPNLLKGKKVVGTEGYILGEMDGLDFDLETWQANAFYVTLSSEASAELKFEKTFGRKIVICLPTELIEAIGDVITLSAPVRSLKDIAEKEVEVNPTSLHGKKVVSAKGYVVGEVEGFDVDFSSWKINGLQVSLADEAATELGFKRPLLSKVLVIIPAEVISSVGNFVDLDKAVEDLKTLVECIRSCKKPA